ncbi:MAG: sulfite exporter TauE/SafE family protein [Gammaproteobacteria bacterium]|nr:sulfite exporter TauE/SafE family protein [Gammaproteobacteria bacterium]
MIDFYVYGVFLAAVALGAWLQATSGFALGLIVMAIVQVSGVLSIAETAAAISVLAFVNIAVSLIDTFNDIDRRLFLFLTFGQLPAIALGIALLNYLTREATVLLEIVFALFLIIGSFSLALNPTPKERRSSALATTGVGFAGGIFGGMFAASGPVVGWFAYRQPIVIASIRASLLAMLGVTTCTRTVLVWVDGIFTQALIWIIITAVPVVFLATYLARRFQPKITDRQFRRAIFTLVFLVGCWILSVAVAELLRESL